MWELLNTNIDNVCSKRYWCTEIGCSGFGRKVRIIAFGRNFIQFKLVQSFHLTGFEKNSKK